MKKKVFTFLTVLIAVLWTVPAAASVISAERYGRLQRLTTSNNSEYYALIQLDGDSISLVGRFASDVVTDVFIPGVAAEELKMNTKSDGSFEASVVCPGNNGFCGNFCIRFKSGAVIYYYIMYENGWFFPDNGLAGKNAAAFDDIRTVAPSTAALYLSPTADADEIERTLEELKVLAAEIVGDERDDYKKARLICRWVAENLYYDNDAAKAGISLENVAVCRVLENRRTTCAGFANTFSALLEAAGIESVNIKGAAFAGEVTYDELATTAENHEWTAFWYGGEKRWVYADPCWCSGNNYTDGIYCENPFDEAFFDITEEAFALSHRNDKLERRSYFAALEGVKPPTSVLPDRTEKEETSTSEEKTELEETEPEQTEPEKTAPDENIQTKAPSAETDPPAVADDIALQKGDWELNPLLVAAAAVLLIAVLVIVAYIIIRNKNKKDGK